MFDQNKIQEFYIVFSFAIFLSKIKKNELIIIDFSKNNTKK